MARAGRAIRDQQRYREPERVAATKGGVHFVPTVIAGTWCPLDVPVGLRFAMGRGGRAYPRQATWTSYPAPTPKGA